MVGVYKTLFGPRFRVCGDCFDPLSGKRSYVKRKVAWKTAVNLACGLCYRQNRDGEVGSRLLRAARMETGFSDPFLLTLSKPGNYLSERV